MGDWLNPRHVDRKRARELVRFWTSLVPGLLALWVIDYLTGSSSACSNLTRSGENISLP